MIRTAIIEDCQKLAFVHVNSWQQAYVGLVPQWYLDNLSINKRAASWKQTLLQGNTTVLLDFAEDELAGFVAVAPSRDADAAGDWGEVGALYYLQSYWGQGRSRQLLDAALDFLRSNGSQLVTLWVLRDNARAIAFYRTMGFEMDGAEKVDESNGFILHELRMCA